MVNDLNVADWGPTGGDVQEAALAMTRAYRCSAFQSKVGSGNGPARAARGNNQSANWTASDIGSYGGIDASVAVANATMGSVKFVIFAMNNPGGGQIRYATYQPDAAVTFTPWTTAFDSVGTGIGNDKPWVIRRTPQDFFMFWFAGGSSGYSYLRTSDGTNWGSPGNELERYSVRPTPSQPPFPGTFCCQPSVGADGRVYLAHSLDLTLTGGTFRVLVGEDPEGDASGPLHFEYLLNSSGTPLEIPLRTWAGDYLPVPDVNGQQKCARVPYLVCDPTSADRAYIFFHEVAADDPDDVNVYCARLIRISGSWSASVDLIREEAVQPEPPFARADQFTPVAAADSKGWLHVIYYDNRPAPGLSGWWRQYDVRYALSTDHGLTWTHRNLRTDPEALPILDLNLQGQGIPAVWGPREYNGIAIYESGGVTHVWVTYMGANADTSPEEDPQHLSRIFSSHIVVGP